MSGCSGLRKIVALATVLLVAATAWAGETTKRRPATILARVLSYELTLGDRAGDSVGIGIVYKPGDAQSEANAADWQQALAELSSVRIKDKTFFAVRLPNQADQIANAVEKEGVDVLLVTDGLRGDAKAVASFARSHHVLTAGNSLAYVEGDLTLCIVEENEKTRIFINLNNAGLESIRFSSNLLKLASLVH